MSTIVRSLCQPLADIAFDAILEKARRRLNRVTARLFPTSGARQGMYEAFSNVDVDDDGLEHAEPPDSFPQNCRTALARLGLSLTHSSRRRASSSGAPGAAEERVLLYTRPLFARRAAEDVCAVVLAKAFLLLWCYVLFGFESKGPVIAILTLTSLLALALGGRLYHEYHGRRWVVVTSERIVLIEPAVLVSPGEVTVMSVYPPSFARVESYPDGSGEIRFYTTYTDWNNDSTLNAVDGLTGGDPPSIVRLSHMPDVMSLYRAISGPDSSLEVASSLLDADPDALEMGDMGRSRGASAADARVAADGRGGSTAGIPGMPDPDLVRDRVSRPPAPLPSPAAAGARGRDFEDAIRGANNNASGNASVSSPATEDAPAVTAAAAPAVTAAAAPAAASAQSDSPDADGAP